VGWIPGNKAHENEGEVIEHAPQERFALRAQDKQGRYANTFTLTPLGQATTVTFRLEFLEMHGLSALLLPLLFPLTGRKTIRARMVLLKAKVEASSQGSGA
jgi:hypothetical protein